MLLLVASLARAACEEPVFAFLPPPPLDERGRGVATGTALHDGAKVVGGRFALASRHPVEVWRTVLTEVDAQDEWLPERFGYEEAEWLDPSHMYMRFDIGFLFGSVRVRRQLVVEVLTDDAPGRFRTCWRMVDPAPWLQLAAPYVADVPWERAITGWWEVTGQPDGTTLVGHQWWADSGRVPRSIVRFGITRTLPDLLQAFEARVGERAARR